MSEFKYNAEAARRVSNGLNRGFAWDATAQKWAFWNKMKHAFDALGQDDVLEFEELVEEAVKFVGSNTEPDYGNRFHIPPVIREAAGALMDVFCWDDTLTPLFWSNLHSALYYMEDNNTEGFNEYMTKAVESYNDL